MISFDLPLYSAEIYHTDYPKTNPWTRVFNHVETQGQSQEEKENELADEATRLFAEDGFDLITVQTILIAKLETFEGGGDDAEVSG